MSATDLRAAAPTLRHCRTQADLLLKDLRSDVDDARAMRAAERFRALPDFAPLDAGRILAWRDDVRRKHALAVVAAEHGYASWTALKAALDPETPALLPERVFGGVTAAFLNRWFRRYDEALAALEAGGAGSGVLFPYRAQFVVCDVTVLDALGLDAADPDWARIGWNWVQPADGGAHRRLAAKLAARGYAEARAGGPAAKEARAEARRPRRAPVIRLRTNASNPALAFRNFTRQPGHDGCRAVDLEVRAGAFAGSTRLFLAERAWEAFAAAVAAMDRSLAGSARLADEDGLGWVELAVGRTGEVRVTGELARAGESGMQRLQFAFATDQTALAPLARELRDPAMASAGDDASEEPAGSPVDEDAPSASAPLAALGRTVLLVRDYDEALRFYRDAMGFVALHDETTPDGQRFLHLGVPGQRHGRPPRGAPPVGLWLLEAAPGDDALVGRQAGGQPLLVLYTEDCAGAVAELAARGVRVKRPPAVQGPSVFAHVLDLYGNEIVVVEAGGSSET